MALHRNAAYYLILWCDVDALQNIFNKNWVYWIEKSSSTRFSHTFAHLCYQRSNKVGTNFMHQCVKTFWQQCMYAKKRCIRQLKNFVTWGQTISLNRTSETIPIEQSTIELLYGSQHVRLLTARKFFVYFSSQHRSATSAQSVTVLEERQNKPNFSHYIFICLPSRIIRQETKFFICLKVRRSCVRILLKVVLSIVWIHYFVARFCL